MDRKVELITGWFPRLVEDEGFRITSPETRTYNCIAWAEGMNDRWIWPVEPDNREVDMFWNNTLNYNEDIETFVSYYKALGFVETSDADSCAVGAIAIYVKDGKCTHAARKLPSGMWTSKLGAFHDIQHSTLSALEGFMYGKVYCVMTRAVE